MFWLFVNFLGDFVIYLGGDSSSYRMGKIRRNEKFVRIHVVLKLELKVKNY